MSLNICFAPRSGAKHGLPDSLQNPTFDSMNVLIIDDDIDIRKTLALALSTSGHESEDAANAEAALKKAQGESFDAAFLDIRLGSQNGLDLLPELLKASPGLPVVVMTAYSSIETAVQAMQRGAFDYLTKPFKPAQVNQLLARIAKTRRLENRISELEGQVSGAEYEFSSREKAVLDVMALAQKSAPSNANILILGESGTGKSILARHIHQLSARKNEAFVTVSCPSLSRELFESELFGHIKGSFTGAVATTWGKVATADRGTLFLDEIGELPMEVQPKLLRLLQEREYERIGESKARRADVRVIAATNRNLSEAVVKGTFREDLLYRIDVISLRMPPLRERAGDILPLAELQLRGFARQTGKQLSGFTSEARQALERYSWPGNIRELRNVIERATILAEGGLVDAVDLPGALMQTSPLLPAVGGKFSIDEIEAEHIRQILASSKSVQDAAETLKVDPTTLLRKRKNLNL